MAPPSRPEAFAAGEPCLNPAVLRGGDGSTHTAGDLEPLCTAICHQHLPRRQLSRHVCLQRCRHRSRRNTHSHSRCHHSLSASTSRAPLCVRVRGEACVACFLACMGFVTWTLVHAAPRHTHKPHGRPGTHLHIHLTLYIHLNISIYMFRSIHIYNHTNIYTNSKKHISIYTYMRIYMSTRIQIYTQTYIHTYIYTYKPIYRYIYYSAYSYLHTCMYACSMKFVYIHAYIYIDSHS